jgi:uncharacterized protein
MKPQRKTKQKAGNKKSVAVSRASKGSKTKAAQKADRVQRTVPSGKGPRKSRIRTKKSPPLPKPANFPAPPRRKAPEQIPPVLLEGDTIPAPVSSGPGNRYILGPGTGFRRPGALQPPGDLPEGYGTERVFLTARDPHCLYAYWDLNREQRRKYNSRSVEGHLCIRVYISPLELPSIMEAPVHPESQGWFLNVPHGGRNYIAELGYYSHRGEWRSISRSAPASTPPETASDHQQTEFTQIPIEIRFEELIEAVQVGVNEPPQIAPPIPPAPSVALIPLHPLAPPAPSVPSVSPVESLNPIPIATPEVPQSSKPVPLPEAMRHWVSTFPAPTERWSSEQARALAQATQFNLAEQMELGSLEAADLARAPLLEQISSAAPPEYALPAHAREQPLFPPGISSPVKGPLEIPSGEKPFWFNINAELVIYGATERDARVAIGGRPIRLRPDGTFSLRFSLPDGAYEMPVEAISADGVQGRAARLQFRRGTEYRGEVAAHPQDPALKAPHPENAA